MTTSAGVGLSRQTKGELAGSEAARQAVADISGPADFIITFISDNYEPETVIGGIREVTGVTPLLGCYAPGVFTSGGFGFEAVAVMALQGPKVTLALAKGIQAAPHQIGRMVAARLAESLAHAKIGVESLIVLALLDSMSGSSAEVIESVVNGLGPFCLLAGGASADNFKFNKAFQFINAEISTDALAAALLQSPTPIAVGISHGYKPVGRPLVTTRSISNVIYELDGQPAFDVYRQTWTNEVPEVDSEGFATFVKAHPLGLPQLRGEYIIRDLVRVHPNGAIECVSTVPENAVIHMMRVDRTGLLQAARSAAEQALTGLAGNPPAAVIVFDCVSRLDMFGDDKMAEVNQVREVIGRDTPLIGMFSFGEVAIPPKGGLAAFHNKTVVVCALA